MPEFTAVMQNLVASLDAEVAGLPPDLLTLGRILERAPLGLEDVRAWVKEQDGAYHRASVVRRDGYELLVITWKRGQGSHPHDHTGAISALKVVVGDAVEDTFVIDDEGYAAHVASGPLPAGALTAWHDAGVHAVRNAGHDTLVTVNVYAPPLGPFRRFNVRPVKAVATIPASRDRRTVLVVGGGFSGTMAAAQLVRQAELAGVDLRVVLAERTGAIGEGVAYGTSDEAHLLNVPAGRMSAWPDKPDDFVNWASRVIRRVDPGEFVPRAWYGRYVRETLLAVRRASHRASCEYVFDETRRLSRRPEGGWVAHFARGSSIIADDVVLAIGHRPPADPLSGRWEGPKDRYVANPWGPFAMRAISPEEPVLILGSGLTAIDAMLSICTSQRPAPVTLVSRRGLLPRAHVRPSAPPADLTQDIEQCLRGPRGPQVRDLVRRMRRCAIHAVEEGRDWRAVIDGLRPFTAALWRAADDNQRDRFLRHVRPLWEVLRHRMAPELDARLQAWFAEGSVRVVAGRVDAVRAGGATPLEVTVRCRGENGSRSFGVGWVINCTGPSPANRPESNPAIGSLLLHGWVCPDALDLGLRTTVDGRAVSRDGDPVPDLHVIGTLRKPAAWESTAVPELRVQAESAAATIVTRARVTAVPKAA